MPRYLGSPIAMLEEAYRTVAGDEAWVEGVVDAAGAVFGKERGAVAYVIQGRRNPETGHASIAHQSFLSRTPLAMDPTKAGARIFLPEEMQDKLWFSSIVADTLSHRTGLGPDIKKQRAWAWGDECDDVLGLHGQDGQLGILSLAIPLPKLTTLSAREMDLWMRVATHVGTAYRLRQHAEGKTLPELSDVIFSRDGKVEHVTLPRSEAPAVLSEGFERKRFAHKNASRVENALEAWKGLHEGTWSLVDYIDTDGKAFVLAVKNQPDAPTKRKLTERERSALALAALGHPNKQIAYALGLTTSAVAMLLTRARRKLGEKSRVSMIRAFRRSLL